MYCALTSIARRWSFTISRITPLRSRVGNGQRRFRIINERAATSGRSRDSKNNFVLRGSKTRFIEAFRESPFSSSSAVTCQTVFPDRKRTPLTLLMARQNDAVQGEPRSFISLRQNTEDKQSGIQNRAHTGAYGYLGLNKSCTHALTHTHTQTHTIHVSKIVN